MSTLPPPGWYPDPDGGARARWWTGRDWGQLAVPPAGPGPHPVAPVREAPPRSPGVPTGTVWAYVQAVLLLLSVLTVLPTISAFGPYFRAILDLQRSGASSGAPTPEQTQQLFAAMSPVLAGSAITAVLGLVVYAVFIVLAALDVRELRRRGIAQPFPWPWAFLTVVYPIGRAVVVHRRTGGGLGPLWVFVGVYIVSVVLQIVVMAVVVGGQVAQLSQVMTPGTT